MCSAEEWVSDGGFAPGVLVEHEKVLQQQLDRFVDLGLKSVVCPLGACGPQHLVSRAGEKVHLSLEGGLRGVGTSSQSTVR